MSGAPDPILKTAGGTPFGLFVDIDWKGDVARRLISASARMGDRGPLVRAMGVKLTQSMRKNILEQRSPDGVSYAPLKHSRAPGHNPGTKVLFDSGRFYESISWQQTQPDAVTVGSLGGLKYPGFLNTGTRPYVIRPKTAKRLRLWGGNGWVFSKQVNHPGIVARPWLGVRPGDLPEQRQLIEAFAQAALEDRAAA